MNEVTLLQIKQGQAAMNVEYKKPFILAFIYRVSDIFTSFIGGL